MIHLILIYPTLPLERRKKHLCVPESVAEMFSRSVSTLTMYCPSISSLLLIPNSPSVLKKTKPLPQ